MRQAFLDHGVIFLHDQNLSPEQHLAFARRWAAIDINRFFKAVPGYPEIADVRKEAAQTTSIGGGWHTDHSYDEVPAMGSILLARELPSIGGDTLFANMGAAYDALSPGLRKTLDQLQAVHSTRHVFGPEGGYANAPDAAGRVDDAAAAVQDMVHPVVIRHPDPGRKTLYVNAAFTVQFDGWTVAGSEPLLRYLYQPRQFPVRLGARRHLDRRRSQGVPVRQLHFGAPAPARRAAQGGEPDRVARQPGRDGGHDPRADLQGTGRPAARPDFQLGRSRVDRTDDPDAGDPVRVSVRRPQAADLVVGCGDHDPRHRRDHIDRHLGRTPGRTAQVPGLFHPAVERTRQRAAQLRPGLDAGARPRHARHGAEGIPGQPDPADRGRQRHHAQLDDRRPAGAAPEPGGTHQVARRPGADRQHHTRRAVRPRRFLGSSVPRQRNRRRLGRHWPAVRGGHRPVGQRRTGVRSRCRGVVRRPLHPRCQPRRPRPAGPYRRPGPGPGELEVAPATLRCVSPCCRALPRPRRWRPWPPRRSPG